MRRDQRRGKGNKSRNQSDGPISKRQHKRLTIETQSIGARARGLGIRKLHYGTNAQSSTRHRAGTTQARLGTQLGKENELAAIPVDGAGPVEM